MRKYSEEEIKKIVESELGSCELSELMHIPASTIRRIRREKGKTDLKRGKYFPLIQMNSWKCTIIMMELFQELLNTMA